MLETALNVHIRKIDFYIMALRHKSAARNIHNLPESSNERLEFLGDAILDAAVAHYLYDQFSEAEEGELTQIKSRIVSRSNLNKLAQKIGIGPLLETDLQATHSRDSIGGNALEALFGAMYLDLGYGKTHNAILHLLHSQADLKQIANQESDFKSRLYEEAHRLKQNLNFKTIGFEPTANKKRFRSEVFLNGNKLGEGEGSSKKKAEQNAARLGIEKLNGAQS